MWQIVHLNENYISLYTCLKKSIAYKALEKYKNEYVNKFIKGKLILYKIPMGKAEINYSINRIKELDLMTCQFELLKTYQKLMPKVINDLISVYTFNITDYEEYFDIPIIYKNEFIDLFNEKFKLENDFTFTDMMTFLYIKECKEIKLRDMFIATVNFSAEKLFNFYLDKNYISNVTDTKKIFQYIIKYNKIEMAKTFIQEAQLVLQEYFNCFNILYDVKNYELAKFLINNLNKYENEFIYFIIADIKMLNFLLDVYENVDKIFIRLEQINNVENIIKIVQNISDDNLIKLKNGARGGFLFNHVNNELKNRKLK